MIVHATRNISATTHAVATNLVSFLMLLWVRWFIPTTAKCVALTIDLEIEGRMILHMKLVAIHVWRPHGGGSGSCGRMWMGRGRSSPMWDVHTENWN